MFFFFFSSRRRHTRCYRDWSSDVCSSDLDYLLDRCGAEIVRHQADFFVFFGGGGDGFAELGEAEHGGRPVSHGVMKRTEGGTLRLLEARCSHRIGAI